jgi:hypothetical protein
MAEDIGRKGFLGTLGGIAAGIGSLITGFFALSARELLKLINYLRDKVVSITQDALKGLHQLGRALAKAIRSLDQQTGDGLAPALLDLHGRIGTIKDWLTGKFGPLLAWLLKIKNEFDKIYKKWIRPILDTIDFIHLVNTALTALHINVLHGVDNVLQEAQDYIDHWVDKIRGSITKIQNSIDSIVTLDGLFQRVTLITSLGKYAPDWMKMFWNRQVRGLHPAERDALAGRKYSADDPTIYGAQLGGVLRGEDNKISGYVGELVPLFKTAAGSSQPISP